MDPEFFAVLADIAAGLRYVFETKNALTIALSATGTGGMEACLANLLEPGDRLIVGVAGYFAERVAHIGGRLRAEVVRVNVPWGTAVDLESMRTALDGRPAKVIAMVHGETSTGVLQPLESFGALAHEHDALLLVDAVASLTGAPLPVDALDIDVCYSGSQKCLGAPPGLAPVTVNERARGTIAARTAPVSYYFDLLQLERYWFGDHVYHHTPPVNLYYSLREALRLIEEETVLARIQRHARVQQSLLDGLASIGLLPFVEVSNLRLPSVTTVRIPDGIDGMLVRRTLLQRYQIEIAGGLGELNGKVWRIGLMGYSCQDRNVALLLRALGRALGEQGYRSS
jgi:alanine-glyoxylate transaminase/serine-glyoxylate transaminase/serine-pyruvate transaminase